jgi:hypothetical protein
MFSARLAARDRFSREDRTWLREKTGINEAGPTNLWELATKRIGEVFDCAKR